MGSGRGPKPGHGPSSCRARASAVGSRPGPMDGPEAVLAGPKPASSLAEEGGRAVGPPLSYSPREHLGHSVAVPGLPGARPAVVPKSPRDRGGIWLLWLGRCY